ncbi:hypothetical protein [Mycobacterium palustre]|uniref:hypothetical protein n=1 Tax=Mycobacterium palustre TaxID=153971 RepID=UPI00114D9DC9|nr:hypothetical protein [Mycobacterium palustre]MCV7101529.1 hypothetical protein [Mycobacterium palustre]
MKRLTVTAVQRRRLRDGRQMIEITHCPYCGADHWVITDPHCTLAYAPCAENRPLLFDGLGEVIA